MVREAVEGYEWGLRREMEEGEGCESKMWRNLNKLRGRGSKKEEEVYYEGGRRLEAEEAARKQLEFCRGVFGGGVNRVGEVWDEKVKEDLLSKHEEESRRWRGGLREHLDMALPIDIYPMETPSIVGKIEQRD